MVNYASYLYLICAVCFILALKSLTSFKTLSRSNILAISGMALAVMTTILDHKFTSLSTILSVIIIGGSIGCFIARKVRISNIPQVIAIFHFLIGLSAILITAGNLLNIADYDINDHKLRLAEIYASAAISTIVSFGSLLAFAKLQGLIKAEAVRFRGQLLLVLLVFVMLITQISYAYLNHAPSLLIPTIILSLLLTTLIILAISRAEIPLIMAVLNSLLGLSTAIIGFILSNSLLIITGALVSSGGFVISCAIAKNKQKILINLIFGNLLPKTSQAEHHQENFIANFTTPEDAAFALKNSRSLIIAPGYGMAVAQAHFAIKELSQILQQYKVKVKFAIHPLAGRMPGHINALLAEAKINYNMLYILDEINSEFASTDVVLVVGANDIVNPAAKTDKSSPLYGMPILNVSEAKTVFYIKRSKQTAYANKAFCSNNSLILSGDAKAVIEQIIKELQ